MLLDMKIRTEKGWRNIGTVGFELGDWLSVTERTGTPYEREAIFLRLLPSNRWERFCGAVRTLWRRPAWRTLPERKDDARHLGPEFGEDPRKVAGR